ncbi:MAG: hypothetical protein KatS3mg023_3959 [Armatimonadota bacterium]|nr:MAG: hypothetical protein KatS3mg023_3959 [Armatimonadota bacterium]
MHDEIPNKYTYFCLVTTSEKMFMRSLLALVAFVTGAVFLSCSSDSSSTVSGENHPPVIDSIVVAGAAIVGQPVTVTCYARDPDGDELELLLARQRWRHSRLRCAGDVPSRTVLQRFECYAGSCCTRRSWWPSPAALHGFCSLTMLPVLLAVLSMLAVGGALYSQSCCGGTGTFLGGTERGSLPAGTMTAAAVYAYTAMERTLDGSQAIADPYQRRAWAHSLNLELELSPLRQWSVLVVFPLDRQSALGLCEWDDVSVTTLLA